MIDRKHQGAKSELIASAYLLDLGYEVFRNVSSHGLGDLVGWRKGAFTVFDVKTIRSDSGSTNLTSAQIEAGVSRLNVYPDGRCQIVEIPSPSGGLSRDCAQCGSAFSAKSVLNIFCSAKCSGKDERNRKRDRKIASGIEIKKIGRPRRNRRATYLEPIRRV